MTLLIVGTGPTARRAAELLAAAGHVAHPYPVIETVPVASAEEVRAALRSLPPSGWIILSSPAAVRHLAAAAGQLAHEAPALLLNRLAAVQGPGTANQARAAGLAIELEAAVHTAEGMLETIAARVPAPGPGLLLPTAERGRGVLERGLREGGYRLTSLVLYRTQSIAPAARQPLPSGKPDAVIFTSPSAVRAYLDGESLPEGAELVALGSTTERELRRAGLHADRICGDYSIEGLVQTMMTANRRPGIAP